LTTTHLRLLFSQLLRLEARLRGELDTELKAQFGLVVSQFEALSAMGSHEECQLRDITDGLSLTTGGASKLVDRLESAGLCQRQPHPQDRRSAIIRLTPAGRTLLGEASQTIEAVLHARIGSALTPSSLRRLAALLEALAASTVVSG
jgi:DNA-binding MarR family transcriptional regulator